MQYPLTELEIKNIIERHISCTCGSYYKDKRKKDPNCIACVNSKELYNICKVISKTSSVLVCDDMLKNFKHNQEGAFEWFALRDITNKMYKSIISKYRLAKT